jgi:NAD(P)-dependent dehydrogenase (short-subunit alcohol dehydrogenase family)
MHIILGGNGHVGSAVAQTLLSQGEPVTIVSRSSASIPEWQKRGAMVEVVDAHNTVELRRVFTKGKRLFLLNPPAEPATDTDVEERKSLASILEAITDSGLEKSLPNPLMERSPVLKLAIWECFTKWSSNSPPSAYHLVSSALPTI